jgi:phage tail-like protein
MSQTGFITIEEKNLPHIEGRSIDESCKKEEIVKNNSQIPECIWYRLVMDADFPEGTHATIAYVITDEDIKDVNKLEAKWSKSQINPKDILIVGPKGKYLWLKVTVSVDDPEAKPPIIRSIKLYFSKATYLGYLPEIYQEDPNSKVFLERYLSVFEAVLANLESHIDDVPQLFDAQETRSDFLPWLSTWLGAVKDENWPEDKWRIFLSRAVELYKIRGTKAELEEIIDIFSGAPPVAIIEPVLLKYNNQELEVVFNRLFGGKYSFCVLLKPNQVKTETDRKVIKRIIDSEKPAHTQGGLAVIENRLRLDWHTYLEINTYLSEPKAEMIIGKAVVPLTTVVPSEDENFK